MAKKSNQADATLLKDKKYNVEKVTDIDPDTNKGLAKRLASANVDNNPKARTGNCSGGPTKKGKEN